MPTLVVVNDDDMVKVVAKDDASIAACECGRGREPRWRDDGATNGVIARQAYDLRRSLHV